MILVRKRTPNLVRLILASSFANKDFSSFWVKFGLWAAYERCHTGSNGVISFL